MTESIQKNPQSILTNGSQEIVTYEPNKSLLVSPAQQSISTLIFATGSSTFAIANQEVFSEMMRIGEPVVESVLTQVYHHPEIARITSAREVAPVKVDDLRRDYPTVISAIGSLDMREINQKYPGIAQRVALEMARLERIPEGHDVNESEVLLRLLIEDGYLKGASQEDYNRVVESHTLYGELADALFDSDLLSPTSTEGRAFIEIAQKQLAIRRLFELSNEGDEEQQSGSSIKDHGGRVAQVKVLRKIINMSESLDMSKNMLKSLQTRLDSLEHRLHLRHPDQYPSHREELGMKEGADYYGWVDHPGAPDLSKAEQIDLGHGGKG